MFVENYFATFFYNINKMTLSKTINVLGWNFNTAKFFSHLAS